MEKREKIMLGMMAATAVVAGALHFSGVAGPAAPPAQAVSHVNLDEVSKNVEQAKLTKEQAYRIDLLAGGSSANPFYGGAGGLSQEDGGGLVGSSDIVYSGYIRVGQKIYAVLNGVEYARGDELAEGGYTIQSIDKNLVVLERTDGSTGRKLTKRVPLVEDDTDKIRIRVVKTR